MNETLKRAALFLLAFYQAGISPYKRPCCRFYPTCSNYAIEAVRRYGALRGIILAAKRFCRCHPLSVGGYDPVP